MECIPTRIPAVLLIRPRVFGDDRGYFLETWQQRRFRDAGIDVTFVQDNLSRSTRGTLRGLHYQMPQEQGKLVSVVRGEVFDVAVDLRESSPTFGRWVATVLSDRNHEALWIPPGFAHGFLTLSETADFLYKCTDYYAPSCERSIRWDDPTLGIEWPALGEPPILSPKDAAAHPFSDAEYFA